MIQLLLALIYLSFISLGLPDSLLGAAWPSMYIEFGVPVSYAGAVSVIIAVGAVISSLQSDRLTKKYGTGRITAFSVSLTAVSLFGFSLCHSFPMLCLWAVPYGLGAGSVDASLNNYVALHYKSRHMSWLHCMWGVGASAGPYIMRYALTGGKGWNMGYRYVAFIQMALTVILFVCLPLWRKSNHDIINTQADKSEKKALTLKQVFRIKGTKEILTAFFCYCAIEQTAGLWAGSYFVLHNGMSANRAAGFASMLFIGITVGRAISGFLTFKLNDVKMIRLGQGIILAGIILLLLPFGETVSVPGLILIGLGCAPIFPCVIHSTPEFFGADKSQAIIGIQMAYACIGTCVMPPLFGVIANVISIALLPVFLLILLVVMFLEYEFLLKKIFVDK